MDLRRFLLFLLPLMGAVLLALALLLFLRDAVLEPALLVVLGLAALLVPRRVLARHEQGLREALAVLDPEGNPTDEPSARITRVAALHREELNRSEAAVAELEKASRDAEVARRKEKSQAAEMLKQARRQGARLARWLENTPGCLLRLDGEGVVRWLNPGAEELMAEALRQPIQRWLSGWKPGRSGEFPLRLKTRELVVRVESSPPEAMQGEGCLVLLRDLSGEQALAAAREATERARQQLRDAIAAIVPQTTPEETLQEIAPQLFDLVGAAEITLALPGEAGSFITWTALPSQPVQSRDVAPRSTRFDEVFESGEERLVLDLGAEPGAEDERPLVAAGITALGVFPLRQDAGVFAGVRFGFTSAEEMSPATVATLHQLLPAMARAVRGTLRFQGLQARLERWRWYLDHLPDPVFLCSPEGTVRYANRRATALAPPGSRIDGMVPAAQRATFEAQLRGGCEQGRVRFETPLGVGEAAAGELHVIRVDLGEERMLLGVMRDISKRKAEAAEVHRREEEAEELYQLALDLGRSLDLPWVLEQIFVKALEVTHLDFGWATLIERETGSRELASSWHIDLDVVRQLYDEQGHAGFEDRVLRTKKPVVLESMREDPTISPAAAEQSGVRSLISVPLLLEGEVVGVLNLGSSRSYQFKVQDIENLGTFGRIFSRGVFNCKRFHETRRRAENYKLMIGEQHAKLKALAEDISAVQDRLNTYRGLLTSLWGVEGALHAISRQSAREVADGAGAASSWELAFAIAEALPLYVDDSGATASPTDLTRFGFALREDDRKALRGTGGCRAEDRWEIRESLPRVSIVTAEVREVVRLLLNGFRPLAAEPYVIAVCGRRRGAAIEIAIESRDHFGSTHDLEEAVATLSGLPGGRPHLALVLLHLVRGILERRGARLRVLRGEGEQISLHLELPLAGGETRA